MGESQVVLSMHQPWASLLVFGVKRIEGRTWDSQHRGRLWIHATAKVQREMPGAPSQEEVEELQAFYTQVHSLDGHVPSFPPAYPTGVLLGSVEVVDVLPLAAMEQWPGLPESCRLEATSPYCFLCQSPKRWVDACVALQGLRDPPGLRLFSWRDFGDVRAMLAPPPRGTEQQKQKPQEQRDAGGRKRGDGGGGEGSGGGGGGGRDTQAAAEGAGAPGGAGVEADPERRLRAVRKKLRQVSETEVG
ncbi:Activating signal cointegrator 1 [Tetrabaena socialis]|uniref:Activating signal cointegrator 1 n=1 Tax=Tetrabaena socialis TaxID=47790 RepID=A0A2J7ZYQ6_9CHLO|nr:Activating signal cointegrator 1 [Tetrabaena socialis]|eukprot:PNH05405.1 Activating signal cointegrator 1 [Tetrabaena socialis]